MPDESDEIDALLDEDDGVHVVELPASALKPSQKIAGLANEVMETTGKKPSTEAVLHATLIAKAAEREAELPQTFPAAPDMGAVEVVGDGHDSDEIPPDPPLVVHRNAFGPGAHTIRFADGRPFGVFMRDESLTPDEVKELLSEAGVEADIADYYARIRAQGIKADQQLAHHPAVQASAAREHARDERMSVVRSAFLKARAGK